MIIPHDRWAELSPQEQEKYRELVRKGDLESLAQANVFYPYAREDRDALCKRWELIKELKKLPPQSDYHAERASIQAQMDEIDAEIERLKERKHGLQCKRDQLPQPDHRRIRIARELTSANVRESIRFIVAPDVKEIEGIRS